VAESAEIVKREDTRLSTLERVLGTGDMAQMIQATKANVNAAIQFAREREFVSEYPIERNGKRVGVRLWFHHPTWQLLGQSFGITAYTDGEPKEVKPGTWQAAAVAALVEDGRVVGRSVGLCAKTEPGKQRMADHHLASTAQARAQRNALRSCLGAVLIAAGFEISDPEAPATAEQVGMLHQLERELGLTHDHGHADAGVESYKNLTRDQASDVIERWQQLVQPVVETADGSDPETPSDEGSGGVSRKRSSYGEGDSGPKAPPGPHQSSDSEDETVRAGSTEPGGSPVGEEQDGPVVPPSSTEQPAGDTTPREDPTLDEPAPAAQWERAGRHGLTGNKALKHANMRFRKSDPLFPELVKSSTHLTKRQLAALIDQELG
jgi:hypothetical protein